MRHRSTNFRFQRLGAMMRGASPGRRPRAVLAASAATALALLVSAAPAGAQVHQPKEVFGSAAQPTFTTPEEMAVIPEGLPGEGDLLVIDAGAQTLRRFKPNGEADPFAALGTNTIDGVGVGACAYPPTPSTDCDKTPQNGLAFGTRLNTQVAVAPASAAAGTAATSTSPPASSRPGPDRRLFRSGQVPGPADGIERRSLQARPAGSRSILPAPSTLATSTRGSTCSPPTPTRRSKP